MGLHHQDKQMNKLFATILVLVLTGCSLTPQSNTPIVIYDLGLLPANTESVITKQSPIKTPSILIAKISSPVWLDNQTIHYRLAYHNPAQLYSYANSRWTAAPAALLTQQIKNYLKANTAYKIANPIDGVQTEYVLHASLEDFSQIFDATDKSHAIIHLNVNLIERRTRSLRAQRKFIIQRSAPTANAAGAVDALITASHQLNDEIIDWLTNELVNN